MNRKAYVACNFNYRIKTVLLFNKLIDLSRSQAVRYTIKVVISQKWCKIEALLLYTTNGEIGKWYMTYWIASLRIFRLFVRLCRSCKIPTDIERATWSLCHCWATCWCSFHRRQSIGVQCPRCQDTPSFVLVVSTYMWVPQNFWAPDR